MARGWPPLKSREVEGILHALGLRYSHSEGGHDFWKGMVGGRPRKVTVASHLREFGPDLLQFMANQAGVSRKDFYRATKATAQKV